MKDPSQGFDMDEILLKCHRLVYSTGPLWAYLVGYAGGPGIGVPISEAKEPGCERDKMLLSAELFLHASSSSFSSNKYLYIGNEALLKPYSVTCIAFICQNLVLASLSYHSYFLLFIS